MLIFTKKDLRFYALMIVMLLISIVTPISLNTNKIEETTSNAIDTTCILIDAGHGEPDGGAVSVDGVKESDLNLQIANKLKDELALKGYQVMMTREDENNISGLNDDSTIRSIKSQDINNRVNLANSCGADFMISIHMNKYEDPKYFGWQTFYSKNSEQGKRLAECIQSGIKETTGIDNKREALKIEGIKIIDKTTIPAVIVECGFLSNSDECVKLQDENYQTQLVEGIICGVELFLKRGRSLFLNF
ncbi:MAG: N-acetylmuramoyl-L-alanine amidase [Clostridia bacterium]|nr:N-acetylmuramoyl-L-alanine amidase [Clostridia bacterium]